MTDRTASAYVSSALLHAAVIALLCLVAYLLNPPETETPKIFELVAGAGDNYAATAAPALGSPDAVKLDLPAPLPPAPALAPPAPEPVPPQPSEAVPAPAPVPVPMPTAKTAAKPKPVPNFLNTVKRTMNRVEKRIELKRKRQEEAAEKRRQMTQAEFEREHPDAAHGAAHDVGRGIASGVVGGSAANLKGGAGGKALTREQGDEMDAYWALLTSRVKDNFVQPADSSDALVAKVAFSLGRDGAISRVHIVRSSGDAEFDQSVLTAFARTRPILPPAFFKGDTVELEFSMHPDTPTG